MTRTERICHALAARATDLHAERMEIEEAIGDAHGARAATAIGLLVRLDTLRNEAAGVQRRLSRTQTALMTEGWISSRTETA
jgi:hypothetical protein